MKVSVVISSFQRFEQLQHCINSVLLQNVNTEIIVVNDCSTDIRYNDLDKIYPTVKFIHLPVNTRKKHNITAGQSLVRNEGIKIATGDWIAFSDDDDFYTDPKKLETQIILMQKYDCKMSSTNMYCYYGNEHPTTLYHTNMIGKEVEDNISILNAQDISRVNYINYSTVIIHKEIIEKTGLFEVEDYEDYEYWKRIMKHTNCVYIHKPMVTYSMLGVKNYSY
jgi:teichuronic acid biosynthesis glycosyltransferase TuaG